ncbi:MAG: hypothetical protein AMS24_02995 [Chlamydiae bacterium SM23_39]|nr:MAG: hypothetical protein AMS24_02995 [Chlamydiae bacterium SM23_39]
MKKYFFLIIFLNILYIQNAQASCGNSLLTTMEIPYRERAQDYLQAYNILKADKTTNSIYFKLKDGSTISNILEINLLNSSTIMFFKISTYSGIKYSFVAIEDVADIGY